MKATISRTALAVASMLVCLGSVQAEDLIYTEFEARLAKIEAQLATQSGLQQAAYACDCCDSSCGCESSCGCDNGCCGNGCCDSCGCDNGCGDSCCGCCDCCNSCGGGGGAYGQVELMFMRAHILEDTFGKLAEEYELAPRFVIGAENCYGLGARLRYWHYGNHLDFVDNNPAIPGGLRTEIDVFDGEVTNRLQLCRTDVTLAAGVRIANLDLTWGGDNDGVDLIGGTVAADVESLLCCYCSSYASVIYGGRLAILGGDWDFQSTTPPGGVSRDDNVVVNEIYGGVEFGCCQNGFDIYSQLKFEIQNWRSDVLTRWAPANPDPFYGTSVGFVGPAFVFGVGY